MSQKSAQLKLQHSEPCDEQRKNRCSTFHLPHAKKRAKEAFFRKWKKYKALESILNAGNFDINLEGLDICGDKDEGLSSEGQKSVVDFDKPITAVEERHLLWKVPRIISSKNCWPLKQFAHLCLNPPSARLGDTVPRPQKRLAEKWGNDSEWVGVVCMH